MTMMEYRSEFVPTKDTLFALKSELWDVYYQYFGEN